MEVTRKKNVLIDLTNYDSLTYGFGQIAAAYAAAFSSLPAGEFHFIYLMRRKRLRDFGSNVTSVPVRFYHKFLPFTLPKADVWHAVNQQRKLLRVAGGTKFVFTIHDFNFLTKKPWKVRRYLRKMQNKVDKAAAVTAVSRYTADVVRQHIDLKGKEIRVIYNGVERIDKSEGRKPAFVTGRPFFFAIGQIRRKKNFHLLVGVMRHFPEHDLYICGDAHFAYAEEVRSLIRECRLTNVFLTGAVSQEEKVWLYRNCEAFLFPSEREGFGLPAVEAMLFGKAVFAADRASLPEICNGYAVMWERLDPEYMARSMRESLPDFYKDKGRIERIKEYAASFSYERHIKAYLDLYRELLQPS